MRVDDDFEETKQSLEVSVDNMAALRQAYPNYFADTRKFLEILDDFEGSQRPKKTSAIDKLDLSFLPKGQTAPKKEKVLYLEYTGNVYWGSDFVGRWEKDFYGTHFFKPGAEDYTAFESSNLHKFKEGLRLWLEGE